MCLFGRSQIRCARPCSCRRATGWACAAHTRTSFSRKRSKKHATRSLWEKPLIARAWQAGSAITRFWERFLLRPLSGIFHSARTCFRLPNRAEVFPSFANVAVVKQRSGFFSLQLQNQQRTHQRRQAPSRAAEVGAGAALLPNPTNKNTYLLSGVRGIPGRFKGDRGFLRGRRGEIGIPPDPLGRRRHFLLLVQMSKNNPSVSFAASSPLRRGAERVGWRRGGMRECSEAIPLLQYYTACLFHPCHETLKCTSCTRQNAKQ